MWIAALIASACGTPETGAPLSGHQPGADPPSAPDTLDADTHESDGADVEADTNGTRPDRTDASGDAEGAPDATSPGDTTSPAACVDQPEGCDDGDACTNDYCIPTKGCVHTAVSCGGDHECLDATCDSVVGCSNELDHSACDDANPCTLDECTLLFGCINAATNQPCDDGDWCTVDDRCIEGTCEGLKKSACEEPICRLTGAAGDEVDCPIGLVRASIQSPDPVNLTYTVAYDHEALRFKGYREVLSGNGGATVQVPPAALSSGHEVTLVPEAEAWKGFGATNIAIYGPPYPSISDAHFGPGGELVGTPEFMSMRMELLVDAYPQKPLVVGLVDGAAVGASGESINVVTEDLWLVAEPFVACATAAECDDGNDCTFDGCDPAVGCFYTALPYGTLCDDSDPCTASSACTAGKCLLTLAANCSDGNPCTVDACDSATGCSWTPSSGGPCEDGDPCTADGSCEDGECVGEAPSVPLEGCVPTPLCALSGPTGTIGSCAVSLAALSADSPIATSLALALQYNAAALKLVDLTTSTCQPDGTCLKVSLAEGGQLLSGHAVLPNPAKLTDWLTGAGELEIAHLTTPATPLNDAHFDATGQLIGSPTLFSLHFELTAPVEAGTQPGVVLLTGASAGPDSDGVLVLNHVLVSYP